MDPPVAPGVETKHDKTEEATGSPKSYDCGLCDTEAVYKIAQELLPGLASACVDNTTGGIFKNAASVAFDMRKEMVDYLTQRSESYVAEVLLAENSSNEEISAHPYDIMLDLIDDFAASKRNMFSRVSEWVLSDRREDRIDDFVQEMEINGFWLLARRECVASMLLKNVDYKNAFHCNMVCSSEQEVVGHRGECKFRPIDCTNEGCTTRYCAAQKENHEAVCPFMVLPCEQKCSDFVMRREMDRHCVTVCPMKLVNCAFYTVGCESSIPKCNLQQHNIDGLSDHLLYILRTAHKDASEADLKNRAEQIQNLSNTEKLARARDARALTYLIKDAEKKLGTIQLGTKPHVDESSEENSPVKEQHDETEVLTQKTTITKDNDTELPTKEDARQESPTPDTEEKTESPSSRTDEGPKEPSDSEGEKELVKSPKIEDIVEKLSETVEKESKEIIKELSTSDEESEKLKKEEQRESSRSDEEEAKKSPKKEEKGESPRSNQEEPKKSPKREEKIESSLSDEEGPKESPKREEKLESSRSYEQEYQKSPKNEEKGELPTSDKEYKEEPQISPKGEERKDSSSSDEEGLKNLPNNETEKTKPPSDSDEEEALITPPSQTET